MLWKEEGQISFFKAASENPFNSCLHHKERGALTDAAVWGRLKSKSKRVGLPGWPIIHRLKPNGRRWETFDSIDSWVFSYQMRHDSKGWIFWGKDLQSMLICQNSEISHEQRWVWQQNQFDNWLYPSIAFGQNDVQIFNSYTLHSRNFIFIWPSGIVFVKDR